MKQLKVEKGKILMLRNVIEYRMKWTSDTDIERIVGLEEKYILSKGAKPVGPVVQHNSIKIDSQGNIETWISLFRQTTNSLDSIDEPFSFKPLVKVNNCLLLHFRGEGQDLKYAFDKLGVYAYENDLKLKGDSYTVFVNQTEDELIADIFMEYKVSE
ncbi:MAG: hypothetical protein LBQ95_02005 [Lachnospiraceae bacterium]|jgi:hypothetical protein|nr:hypothetical protein [Lachnospiraceae bacterium]